MVNMPESWRQNCEHYLHVIKLEMNNIYAHQKESKQQLENWEWKTSECRHLSWRGKCPTLMPTRHSIFSTLQSKWSTVWCPLAWQFEVSLLHLVKSCICVSQKYIHSGQHSWVQPQNAQLWSVPLKKKQHKYKTQNTNHRFQAIKGKLIITHLNSHGNRV